MREQDKGSERGKTITERHDEPVKPEEGRLEKIAHVIDPPSSEIRDRDLNDPGRMTPGAPPTDNRS
jgi:hypothetical protein